MDYPFPARRKRIAALTVSESVCREKAVEGINTSDCHGCWWKKVVKDLLHPSVLTATNRLFALYILQGASMFRSDRVHKDVCVLTLVANCTYTCTAPAV